MLLRRLKSSRANSERDGMHPRSIYIRPPDFAELAEAVPTLKPFLKVSKNGDPIVDFKDPAALRTLTKALLLRDFKRDVYLPEDRLCPPVAGRLDYVLYVQDVIKHHHQVQLEYSGDSKSNADIVGLDIGTGASAIYPMLFTAIDSHVRMIGTDINDASLQIARNNVQTNDLSERIAILQVSPNAGFFEEPLRQITHLDFTMCNPPFYVSEEEMQRMTAEKQLPPNAACTGSPNEMITHGGETAFVARMIRESRQYKSQVSLLGLATSVISLVKELADLGCHNYGLIESSPSQTHRWILLWSWHDVRLPDELARQLPLSSALTKSLPPPNELTYYCKASISFSAASSVLQAFLSDLDLQVRPTTAEKDSNRSYAILASHVSWTRAARRNRIRTDSAMQNGHKQNILMACELSLAIATEPASLDQVELKAIWKRGHDRQCFESFFSSCVRKVAAAGPDRSNVA